MSSVRICLFGVPRLSVDERPVRLPTPKALVVLAHVALQPSRVTRERVARSIWPDDEHAVGLAQVRRHLHYLERSVRDAGGPASIFERDEGTMRVRDDAFIDVRAFLAEDARGRFAEAVALYAGDLLDGFPDESLDAPRAALRERFAAALTALAERAEAIGDFEGVIGWARRHIAHEPTDETAHRRLMTALVRTGERTAALAVYRTLAARLRTELDVEPSAETVALEAVLRRAAEPLERTRRASSRQPPLIGREDDAAALARACAESRLVTLCGAPGIGKTRLAQHIVEAVPEQRGAAVWIDLRDVVDERGVLRRIRAAAGFGESLLDTQLLSELARLTTRTPLLVVFDHGERALPVLSRIAARLRSERAGLRLLIVARERLRQTDERVVRLGPLTCPPSDVEDVEAFAESPAAQLLLRVARAQQPAFAVTRETLPHLVRICRQTDGVPLALEIAAARVHLFGPAETAQLAPDPLADAIAASEEVLGRDERAVLRRCAVFEGDWTRAAAHALCADGELDPPRITSAIERLVETSLLEVAIDGDVTRYRLLAPIRAHARRRLAEAGERERWAQKHVQVVLGLVREQDAVWGTVPASVWTHEMAALAADAEAALEAALESGDPREAFALAAALRTYWYQRDPARGLQWTYRCEAVLPPDAAPLVRGRLALNVASLAGAMRRYDEALPRALEAAAAFTEAGDDHDRALALREVGSAQLFLGDRERAEIALRDALHLFRRTGDAARSGACLSALGCAALSAERFADARDAFLEAVRIANEHADQRTAAATLINLAEVEARSGDALAALRWIERALPAVEACGDRLLLAYAFYNRGVYAREAGRFDLARSALRAAVPLLRAHAPGAACTLAIVQLTRVLVALGRQADAALLAGYLERERRMIEAATPDDVREWDALIESLRQRWPSHELRQLLREGSTLDERAALRLCGVEQTA